MREPQRGHWASNLDLGHSPSSRGPFRRHGEMPHEILSTAAQLEERSHEQVDTHRRVAGFHLGDPGLTRPQHAPRLLLGHLPPRSLLSQRLRKFELQLDNRCLGIG